MRLILKLGMKEKAFVFSLYRFTQELRLMDFHWPEIIYSDILEGVMKGSVLFQICTPQTQRVEKAQGQKN